MSVKVLEPTNQSPQNEVGAHKVIVTNLGHPGSLPSSPSLGIMSAKTSPEFNRVYIINSKNILSGIRNNDAPKLYLCTTRSSELKLMTDIPAPFIRVKHTATPRAVLMTLVCGSSDVMLHLVPRIEVLLELAK